uniref:AlNc14C566G12162 protein n=1 Tax=Albugo laibachii Nc14 TaxID=890382 RepID=F0X169_9STRA|nr:AlNc14C566G12162 [Albugo laibachii Nc14]|eukprot:CCA27526.1 AlNc14C566G12162 [Albugo laibachii Nc14]
MRQRVVDLVFFAAATVDLHFIVIHSFFDIRVVRDVRDVRVGRERVVQGQLLDEAVKMRFRKGALRLVLLSECCNCCHVDDVCVEPAVPDSGWRHWVPLRHDPFSWRCRLTRAGRGTTAQTRTDI